MQNEKSSFKHNEIIFSKLVIFTTLFFLYIFPMSVYSIKDMFTVNRILYNGFLIIIYVYFVLKKYIRITIFDLLLVVFVLVRFLFTKDVESFGLIYLLFLKYLNFKDATFKDKKFFQYLLAGSILFYSWLHHHNNFPQYVSSSIGEVNQVGFTLMMLYLVFRTNKRNGLAFLMLIAGLTTLSRNFFFAFLIFHVVEKGIKLSLKYKIRIYLPKTFKFYAYSSVILVVTLYFLYIYLAQNFEFKPYHMNLNRLLTLFDSSNYRRFIANVAVIKFYFSNPLKLITGVPYIEYAQYFTKYPIQDLQGITTVINAPHNYFFKFLYKYGVVSLIIFKITGDIIDKRLSYSNISYFLVFLLYAVFLGTGFYEAYLFVLIYLMDRNHNSLRRRKK